MPRLSSLSQKQKLYLLFYTNPQSETFDNKYQSARKAGYTEETSKAMRHTKAMKEFAMARVEELQELADDSEARRARILAFAERNIESYVRSTPQDKTDKTIKADMTKFSAERLGKNHYSTRTESVVDDNEGFMRGDRASIIEGTFSRYLAHSDESDAPRTIEAPISEETEHDVTDTVEEATSDKTEHE